MNTHLILISIIIVALSVLALGLNIFFRGKKFPETSVGKNKAMAKRGIHCVKCEEVKKFRKRIKINPQHLKIIS